MASRIDAAIEKFGGGDENRKLQIKKMVRDYMGYENYRSKYSEAGKGGIDISAMKGNITPGGVKQLVNAGLGERANDMDHYNSITDKMDSSASGIAANMLSNEKAGAAKAKQAKEDKIQEEMYNPSDWITERINRWKMDNRDDNGNIITREALVKELEAEEGRRAMPNREEYEAAENRNIEKGFIAPIIGGPTAPEQMREISATMAAAQKTDMDKRIEDLLPEDFEKNRGVAKYTQLGYTPAEAKDRYSMDRFVEGQMTEEEFSIRSSIDPLWAEKAVAGRRNPQLMKDLEPVQAVDPETGEAISGEYALPYTFNQLKDKYPHLTEAALKTMATSAYKNDARDEAQKLVEKMATTNMNGVDDYSEKGMNPFKWFNNLEITPERFTEIKNTKEYKTQLDTMELVYKGALDKADLEQIMLTAFTEYPQILKQREQGAERFDSSGRKIDKKGPSPVEWDNIKAEKMERIGNVTGPIMDTLKKSAEKVKSNTFQAKKGELSQKIDEDMNAKKIRTTKYFQDLLNY